jgi:hypothetical protein
MARIVLRSMFAAVGRPSLETAEVVSGTRATVVKGRTEGV